MFKNNVVVYGVKESEKESWEDTEKKVIGIISEKSDVPIDGAKSERAHRIGKLKRQGEAQDQPRLFICEFGS